MTIWTRSRLTNWLTGNPRVWTGWPTIKPLEVEERRRRLKRLAAHGCPVTLPLEEVDQVDTIIAELRADHRAHYRATVKQIGTEGFWETIV